MKAAGWLKAKGQPMWTADELAPGALLRRYDPQEMRLRLLLGEAAAVRWWCRRAMSISGRMFRKASLCSFTSWPWRDA